MSKEMIFNTNNITVKAKRKDDSYWREIHGIILNDDKTKILSIWTEPWSCFDCRNTEVQLKIIKGD
ncbi:MAG: hypothetical protein ACOC1K_01750 [Nanoarchaeota archaeon]